MIYIRKQYYNDLEELRGIIKKERENALKDMRKKETYPGEITDIHSRLATIECSHASLFHSGDSVGIKTYKKIKYLGTVVDSGNDILTVLLSSSADISENDNIHLINYEPLITYDLQLALISEILNDETYNILFDYSGSMIYNENAVDVMFGYLKQRRLSNLRKKKYKDVNEDFYLDPSQNDAISASLDLQDNELLLIRGPPGTGKTRVIARIAYELIERGESVLISSHTNRAVDNAVELLPLEKTLRVGRPEKVLDHIKPYLLSYKIREKCGEELKSIEINLKKYFESIKKIQQLIEESRIWYEKVQHKKTLRKLKEDIRSNIKKRTEIINRVANELIDRVPVIGATLVKSQLGRLAERNFNTVIIDEASQASVTLALLAMVKADKWIIVGDDRQLLPIFKTVKSSKRTENLGAFTKLLQNYEYRCLWLRVHYRSHPDIIGFSAEYAYNRNIRSHRSCENKILRLSRRPRYEVLIPKKPMVFIHVEGESVSEGRSRYNESEIEVIVTLVRELLRCGVSRDEIGVITPYRAQRTKLAEKLKEVEVGTVDSFQGREKDVIFFSITSVSNLSFVSNPNRLNVAITRAKRKIIIVGNGRAIYKRRDAFENSLKKYKYSDCNLYKLLEYCYSKNAIYDWNKKKWITKK